MKTWYSADVVMFVEFSDGKQTHFPAWENIILVEAESEEAAFEKAEALGRRGEGDDSGEFRWDGRPARWVFAGVRKLTECAVLADSDRPGDGTEVSFSELELDSRADIERLVAGEPVKVGFNDRYRPSLEVPERGRRKPA